MSLQEVAEKSQVTAGLLSKIENFKTVPSLPVLFQISMALDVKMMDLVRDVNPSDTPKYLLIRKDETKKEKNVEAKGLTYETLFSQSFSNSNLVLKVVSVSPKTYRESYNEDALELVYVLSGAVTYGIDKEEVLVEEGDFLFFDGSLSHSIENRDGAHAKMMKMYVQNLVNN
ncbi:quercetin dioxygenase-like cupin family protein [Aureibacter tunicatorum]|uniref:Quercetin dioxygenase-like cupin family protein n=2 Tax=Aureibacter tunicatorum TaxID=866807 RepID=A0AAE3XMZ8_9BACT|nr:quercetin dioxygenase-like cupin family protein [Aureibacter tunicatorum]